MAQIASDLENNHTGGKLSTMTISLAFLIEIFFIQLSSYAFYRDSHTNPYIFLSAMLTLSLGSLWYYTGSQVRETGLEAGDN